MPDPLSQQIADVLANRIAEGDLTSGERLPSETELANQHECSRATVREALKILAARNLIRTKRGATGGAFVNRLTYESAVEDQVATARLLLSINAIDFEAAAEARFALEASCAELACQNHTRDDLVDLKAMLDDLAEPCDDEAFCAADTAFHRRFADAARNEVLSYHLAGAIEAMQPLMNMITYEDRDRAEILALYRRLANALQAKDASEIRRILADQRATMVALYQRRSDRLAARANAT
jgi:DNA-binding FadR family transcriptional regulator